MGSLGINTRRRIDGSVVVELSGELDYATVGLLEEAVREALTGAIVPSVVVDCARLTFVDSTGVGALVAAHRVAGDQCVPLVLTNPSPFVRDLLEITGQTRLIARRR
jgi:anti-sigma B factor antagonist/stage II sporulation protein AA (anti-sigma F factor antagonist)